MKSNLVVLAVLLVGSTATRKPVLAEAPPAGTDQPEWWGWDGSELPEVAIVCGEVVGEVHGSASTNPTNGPGVEISLEEPADLLILLGAEVITEEDGLYSFRLDWRGYSLYPTVEINEWEASRFRFQLWDLTVDSGKEAIPLPSSLAEAIGRRFLGEIGFLQDGRAVLTLEMDPEEGRPPAGLEPVRLIFSPAEEGEAGEADEEERRCVCCNNTAGQTGWCRRQDCDDEEFCRDGDGRCAWVSGGFNEFVLPGLGALIWLGVLGWRARNRRPGPFFR